MSIKTNRSTVVFFLFFLSGILFSFASPQAHAAAYYISKTGSSDSYTGLAATYSSGTTGPFLTIQKALNVVVAGDTVNIMTGTYNESLTLSTTGTQQAPITLQNYNNSNVTIDSGASATFITTGRVQYYIIQGQGEKLNLLSSASGEFYSLDFHAGVWDGETDSTGGNGGFVLNNCYVEGAAIFYGHNNLVENCDFNGVGRFAMGIREHYAASHDNIYRNNIVHDYTTRGIWSMQYTNNVLIQNNTIYNSGNMGIDIDGASNPDYNAHVIGNHIYDVAGRGIENENSFNAIVENNIIHDSAYVGMTVLNYGDAGDFKMDKVNNVVQEMRNTPTNSVYKNNLIFNTAQAGIVSYGSPGNFFYNNTFYNCQGWGGALALRAYYDSGVTNYTSYNNTLKNNIFANSSIGVYTDNNPAGTVSMNNLYYGNNTNGSNVTLIGITGVYVNPLFVTNGSNFALQSSSMARSAGANLTSAGVTSDILGNARPQSSAFDIGAYQYNSSPICSSFTYSNWSDCANGTQSRTVISSAPTGCSGGSPVLSQSCTTACTALTFNSGSTSSSQVAVNGTYSLSCDYGIFNIDSIESSNDLGGCAWSGWNGTVASFLCNAGPSGTRTNKCIVIAGTTANSCAQENSINNVISGSLTDVIPPNAPSSLVAQ